MKKVTYLNNALPALVQELAEKITGKKQGDRLSISAYYGNNSKLFRQSEIDASVCRLYKDTGTGLEQLPCEAVGSKLVFRIVGKERFDALFTIKDSKPVREVKAETVTAETATAETATAETAQTETATAETAQTETATAVSTVQESKVEYKVSAFEQIKALIPALTETEKKELQQLLQK